MYRFSENPSYRYFLEFDILKNTILFIIVYVSIISCI